MLMVSALQGIIVVMGSSTAEISQTKPSVEDAKDSLSLPFYVFLNQICLLSCKKGCYFL